MSISEGLKEETRWRWTDSIPDPDDVPPGTDHVVQHTSVRHPSLGEFHIGDTVQVRNRLTYYWVGIVRAFETDFANARGQQKRAIVQWCVRQRDVAGRVQKTVTPAHVFFNHGMDSIHLRAIVKKCVVCATEEEYDAAVGERMKKRKRTLASKDSPDRLGLYWAAGASDGKSWMWDMDWNEWYKGKDTDFDGIKAHIEKLIKEKQAERTRRVNVPPETDQTDLEKKKVKHEEYVKEVSDDEQDNDYGTPRKKRKRTLISTTPRKPRSTSTTSTPTGRRILKPIELTPLPLRTLSSSLLDTPHKIAQANLHVSAVPKSLPCREDEYAQILEYLENAIEEGTGTCIYISGVPGTGKTATAREVVRALNERVAAEELDDFHFVEINGLKVLDPNQAYAMLWEALTGERITPLHASTLLDGEFKNAGPGRVPCVVLLDELDQLVMAKQTVLYNLFNWPTLPNSRLIVVAIANTMNLADMLPNKIQSRVGLTRVNFEPYTAAQLIQIIESRLKDVPGDIMAYDAIKLCAVRIANNTGDARKALDVCRRAVEVAEREAEDAVPATPSKRLAQPTDAGKVTTRLINTVLQEFHRHPVQKALRTLSFASKLFLAALLAQTRRSSGKDEVTFGDVLAEATTLCQLCVNSGEAQMLMRGGVTTPRGLESAGAELEMCRIIDWEEKGGRRGGRVGLQISEDDLKMAFQQDREWKEMVR